MGEPQRVTWTWLPDSFDVDIEAGLRMLLAGMNGQERHQAAAFAIERLQYVPAGWHRRLHELVDEIDAEELERSLDAGSLQQANDVIESIMRRER